MRYALLTGEFRYQIYASVGKQCTVREIGADPGRDKDTGRRGARLNRGARGIDPNRRKRWLRYGGKRKRRKR